MAELEKISETIRQTISIFSKTIIYHFDSGICIPYRHCRILWFFSFMLYPERTSIASSGDFITFHLKAILVLCVFSLQYSTNIEEEDPQLSSRGLQIF